jgi:hypothetical protein
MFFQDPKSGRIYFFGGNSSGKTNKSSKKVDGTVPLYELTITWDENDRPRKAEIKLVIK